MKKTIEKKTFSNNSSLLVLLFIKKLKLKCATNGFNYLKKCSPYLLELHLPRHQLLCRVGEGPPRRPLYTELHHVLNVGVQGEAVLALWGTLLAKQITFFTIRELIQDYLKEKVHLK